MRSLIYGWILVFTTLAAAAAAEPGPDHSAKWKEQLAKRANSAQCYATCNNYSTAATQCVTNLNTYASCYCSNTMVNNLVSCISCGVTEATTQYEIDLAEQGINQYLQMCSQLGYNDISITVTARPTVSFPCTDNSATPTAATTENTGKPLGTTSAVASSFGGLTPTPTPSPSNPLGGIDPSDLSVINSLLGQLSSFTF